MYKLPDLPYAYDALEPHISGEIMKLHHDKHHQTYVDKLNEAIALYPKRKLDKDIIKIISDLDIVPEDIREIVRNNGGGHYNHSLFWEIMSPDGGGEPSGPLAEAIAEKYGSFQQFVEVFSAKASNLFGSGWVWLQPDMEIITTSNQDSPLTLWLDEPLMGLDVWEHAYYLDYYNVRADYIKAWWNVVNWRVVEDRYQKTAP